MSFCGIVSCRVEEQLHVKGVQDAISLIIAQSDDFQTRSVVESVEDAGCEVYREVLFSDASVGDIYLEVIESDIINTRIETSQTATKAAPYSGSNLGSFTVVSYLNNQSVFFEDTFSSDGSIVSTGYYWPITSEESTLTFFGYAKSNANGSLSAVSFDPSKAEGSFSYALPSPSGDVESAVKQPDLVFAITPDRTNNGTPVSMTFYHALSSIVFATGSVPSQFKVVSATFSGVCSQAGCDYGLDGTSLKFTWKNAGSKTSFLQEFNEEVGGTSGQAINTENESFMMIPQNFTVGGGSTLKMVVAFEDRYYTIEKDLASITSSWLPGKRYTFKISSPDEIKAEISETFTQNTNKKEDVYMTNTGLSNIKVRAAIVGYWVVKAVINGVQQDCIIADWDPENDGTFVGLPGDGWEKKSDGYYYYSTALSPRQSTSHLFDSYTLTSTPPIVGAELVLTVINQSVIDGYEDSTWNTWNN